MKILVTGGAGFIGSHIVDGLVGRGYRVRVLDNLEPQVHGKQRRWPAYRNPDAEYQLGDVRDAARFVSYQEAVPATIAQYGLSGRRSALRPGKLTGRLSCTATPQYRQGGEQGADTLWRCS